MLSGKIETILWDWNGTLLNDVDHCINSMNMLLKTRNLNPLDKARYLNVFTFPVKTYYEALGFDFVKEAFEIPAEEFIVHYNRGFEKVPIFDDVTETLEYFRSAGVKQYIISAMEHNALVRSVEDRGIATYFSIINGISDNLAYGKVSMAKGLFIRDRINPATTLLVGDTLHDIEVATELGVRSILIARGHQSRSRLAAGNTMIFESLTEFRQSIKQEKENP